MSDTRQPEPTVQSAVDRMMPSIVSEIEDAKPGQVRCIVVTPERAVLDETAEMVIVPMFDGELGVLPGPCAAHRPTGCRRIAPQDRRRRRSGGSSRPGSCRSAPTS